MRHLIIWTQVFSWIIAILAVLIHTYEWLLILTAAIVLEASLLAAMIVRFQLSVASGGVGGAGGRGLVPPASTSDSSGFSGPSRNSSENPGSSA